jgi:hypothetical protein
LKSKSNPRAIRSKSNLVSLPCSCIILPGYAARSSSSVINKNWPGYPGKYHTILASMHPESNIQITWQSILNNLAKCKNPQK